MIVNYLMFVCFAITMINSHPTENSASGEKSNKPKSHCDNSKKLFEQVGRHFFINGNYSQDKKNTYLSTLKNFTNPKTRKLTVRWVTFYIANDFAHVCNYISCNTSKNTLKSVSFENCLFEPNVIVYLPDSKQWLIKSLTLCKCHMYEVDLSNIHSLISPDSLEFLKVDSIQFQGKKVMFPISVINQFSKLTRLYLDNLMLKTNDIDDLLLHDNLKFLSIDRFYRSNPNFPSFKAFTCLKTLRICCTLFQYYSLQEKLDYFPSSLEKIILSGELGAFVNDPKETIRWSNIIVDYEIHKPKNHNSLVPVKNLSTVIITKNNLTYHQTFEDDSSIKRIIILDNDLSHITTIDFEKIYNFHKLDLLDIRIKPNNPNFNSGLINWDYSSKKKIKVKRLNFFKFSPEIFSVCLLICNVIQEINIDISGSGPLLLKAMDSKLKQFQFSSLKKLIFEFREFGEEEMKVLLWFLSHSKLKYLELRCFENNITMNSNLQLLESIDELSIETVEFSILYYKSEDGFITKFSQKMPYLTELIYGGSMCELDYENLKNIQTLRKISIRNYLSESLDNILTKISKFEYLQIFSIKPYTFSDFDVIIQNFTKNCANSSVQLVLEDYH